MTSTPWLGRALAESRDYALSRSRLCSDDFVCCPFGILLTHLLGPDVAHGLARLVRHRFRSGTWTDLYPALTHPALGQACHVYTGLTQGQVVDLLVASGLGPDDVSPLERVQDPLVRHVCGLAPYCPHAHDERSPQVVAMYFDGVLRLLAANGSLRLSGPLVPAVVRAESGPLP